MSDELEERIWYGPDNPCQAKNDTNNIFIGNFTILTQFCERFSDVTLDRAWQMTNSW
jgi:hypothetical protein